MPTDAAETAESADWPRRADPRPDAAAAPTDEPTGSLETSVRDHADRPGEASPPDYSLALEEARRGFDQLAAEVSDVRNRAVATLGMGGLSASFLGGLTLRNDAPITGWTWFAIAAFVALAVSCAGVLWRRRFHVSQHPRIIVAWAEQHEATRADMERDLALWLGKKYDDNRRSVDRIGRLLTIATGAFLIEISALLIDLVGR
jgi:hypothetical protein